MFNKIIKFFIKTHNDKLLYIITQNWHLLCMYNEYTAPYQITSINQTNILYISVFYSACSYVTYNLIKIRNKINIFLHNFNICEIKIYTKLSLFN